MDRTSHMFFREKIVKRFTMAGFLKKRANALDTNAPRRELRIIGGTPACQFLRQQAWNPTLGS